jgi:hypothetical protein
MSRPYHHLDLINLITFGEEHRLWISSLCSFIHDPSSSLLGPNVLLVVCIGKSNKNWSKINLNLTGRNILLSVDFNFILLFASYFIFSHNCIK